MKLRILFYFLTRDRNVIGVKSNLDGQHDRTTQEFTYLLVFIICLLFNVLFDKNHV